MSRPSSKSQWRHICQAQRAQLTPVQIHTLSQQICANLRASQILDTAACVLGYWAVKGEIPLDPLFQVYPEKIWGIPRCLPNHGLGWHRYHLGDPLLPNRWGIPEPLESSEVVDPSLAACILIPALACDRSGTRLGYGQGFYDRFLPQVKGLRVAVVPEQGLVETLPRDPWDVPMEVIVTESQIVRI